MTKRPAGSAPAVRLRARASALLGLVGLVLLAACGSGSDHNEADVAFATDMIAHHAQAIAMANSTIGREGLDPRVVELAERTRISQTEELNTLSDWLADWGEPVPRTGFGEGDGHSHSGDDHGGTGATGDGAQPGIGGAEELDALATAPRARFEQMWLEMMIEHHQGAVEMAESVLRSGESEDVAGLAEDIRSVQSAEVADMQEWLRSS